MRLILKITAITLLADLGEFFIIRFLFSMKLPFASYAAWFLIVLLVALSVSVLIYLISNGKKLIAEEKHYSH